MTATPPPELGPFSSMLGFRLVEVGEERVIMEAMPGPEHANGGGILHGGYLTSLLDSTTGWRCTPRCRPASPLRTPR